MYLPCLAAPIFTQAAFSTYHIPCFSLALEAGSQTVPFKCRDIVQCIANVVYRVDPASLHFESMLGLDWGEYHTSEQYAALCAQVREEFPDVSPITGTHCVALVLMVMADKFAVGRLKKTSCYPMYIALMNQLATERYRPSSVSLVGYLPHFASSKTKKRPAHKHLAGLRVLHHSLSILYEPLRAFEKEGVFLKMRDGNKLWAKIYVGYMNSDSPEQNDQSGLKRNAAKKCSRQTLMCKSLIGTITPFAHQRGHRQREFTIRTHTEHKAAVEQVFELIKARTSVNDGTIGRVDRIIDAYSIHPIRNAYWTVPMGPGGIYAATPAEILHLWPQGIMKAIKNDAHEALEIIWKEWRGSTSNGGIGWAVDVVDSRLRLLPQFTDGITSISHFKNGVWSLHWVSAEDHISMFQQMVSRSNTPPPPPPQPPTPHTSRQVQVAQLY